MRNPLCCAVILFTLASQARAAEVPAPGLRPLSGTVGLIDRNNQPLPIYLDRLEAALWLEQAHGTAGPYLVSIANSLEALPPSDLAEDNGRGERLLTETYVQLAAFAGPQAGRLAGLYAAGLAQLLHVPQQEMAVTQELRDQLRRIGAYSAAAAGRRVAALPDTPAARRRLLAAELSLATGRYPEAARQAQAWNTQNPAPVHQALWRGAQLLAGQATGPATAELIALEREGGAAGNLAAQLLRRAAREALVARLGKALGAPKDRSEAELAAVAACREVLKGTQKGPRQERAPGDCLVLLLEAPGSEWADAAAIARLPAGPRRDQLALARALGVLLGLPGQRPATEASAREQALAEVLQLLPRAGLPAEDAGAVTLMARIAAAPKAEVPADLAREGAAYLKEHGCSPLALPVYLGRKLPPQDTARDLRDALRRCPAGQDGRTDEALRTFALALLDLDPHAAEAQQVLEKLASGRGQGPGQGRFLLALADAAARRAFAPGAAVTPAALEGVQKKYDEAIAALLPWDGAEARGLAEAQVATLLLRRDQAQHDKGTQLLEQADAHLRYAKLLSMLDEAEVVQAMEVHSGREALLRAGKPVASPKVEADKLPPGLGRRVLGCELALTARAAKDGPAMARYAALTEPQAPPLPELVSAGTPRLTASLGVDQHLRVTVRGERATVVLPRCALR